MAIVFHSNVFKRKFLLVYGCRSRVSRAIIMTLFMFMFFTFISTNLLFLNSAAF